MVLVDFWTYSCINCLRTIPEQESLYRRYRDRGLTVVGVHTPEFRFEADAGNVGRAVRDLGITYPVVLDPGLRDLGRVRHPVLAHDLPHRPARPRARPPRGRGRRRPHRGDHPPAAGRAGRERRRAAGRAGDAARLPRRCSTPETYVGALRIRRLTPGQTLIPGASARYAAPARLARDHIAFDGGWLVADEAAQAEDGAALELGFRAKGVYLVLDGDGRRRVGRVLLDGRPPAAGTAGAGRRRRRAPGRRGPPPLPPAAGCRARGPGRIRVELPPGTRAYAFTFG